jgi:hypothetical protein
MDNSSSLSFAITQNTVIKSDLVWLHNTEQSVLSIYRCLLRMSLSCGWNLFFAQSCSIAIRLYNKRSDTRSTSDTTHYAHSHQIFNVLSHSPVVCCYHFCTSSTQHMWMCFLSMSRTALSYKSRHSDVFLTLIISKSVNKLFLNEQNIPDSLLPIKFALISRIHGQCITSCCQSHLHKLAYRYITLCTGGAAALFGLNSSINLHDLLLTLCICTLGLKRWRHKLK